MISLPSCNNKAARARELPADEQALRNRIAARMLLAGLLPVAATYLLRLFWKDLLGLPEEYLSYQVLVASTVLIFSALLASCFSRGMILLLRGVDAREALAESLPLRAARAHEIARPVADGNPAVPAFASLLEAGSDAVLLVDHHAGEVLGTSRRFRELFGEGDGGSAGDLRYSDVKTIRFLGVLFRVRRNRAPFRRLDLAWTRSRRLMDGCFRLAQAGGRKRQIRSTGAGRPGAISPA